MFPRTSSVQGDAGGIFRKGVSESEVQKRVGRNQTKKEVEAKKTSLLTGLTGRRGEGTGGQEGGNWEERGEGGYIRRGRLVPRTSAMVAIAWGWIRKNSQGVGGG